MGTVILVIIAIVCFFDLAFFIKKILGGSGANITEWLCYPLFGLIPLKMSVAIIVRLLEAGMIFLLIGSFFLKQLH